MKKSIFCTLGCLDAAHLENCPFALPSRFGGQVICRGPKLPSKKLFGGLKTNGGLEETLLHGGVKKGWHSTYDAVFFFPQPPLHKQPYIPTLPWTGFWAKSLVLPESPLGHCACIQARFTCCGETIDRGQRESKQKLTLNPGAAAYPKRANGVGA